MRRLFIRPGAIGDFILSQPALEWLVNCESGSVWTEIWTAEQNVSLAAALPCFSLARSIGSVGLDRLGMLPANDVVERLRTFDHVDSWYGTARPEFRELVAHLGLPFEFHLALPSGTRAEPSHHPAAHAVDFYLSQVGAHLEPSSPAIPRIPVPTADADTPRRSILLHPFASNPAKRWPIGRFQSLAEYLTSSPGIKCKICWLRGPEEQFPPNFPADPVFIPDPYQLARYIARAQLYVGNDSGITHLAASVGTPVIALFGPTDPAVWRPRGSEVAIIARESMDAISVNEVVISARERLRSLY